MPATVTSHTRPKAARRKCPDDQPIDKEEWRVKEVAEGEEKETRWLRLPPPRQRLRDKWLNFIGSQSGECA